MVVERIHGIPFNPDFKVQMGAELEACIADIPDDLPLAHMGSNESGEA